MIELHQRPGLPGAKPCLRAGCRIVKFSRRVRGAPRPHPPASWHKPLVTISKHRLEMADAMGFASLSPRQGIICPVLLGQ